jgi:uncharacterized protein involved in exopolysaccharide biosynthesis
MPEQASPDNFRQDPGAASAAQGMSAADYQNSLLDLLIVLARNKWLILGVPFLFAVLMSVLLLRATNIYTATTKILPPQQGQSGASAILAQFAGLAGLAGGAAFKNPNEIYVAMLKSRTVADNLIQRFDLVNFYEVKYLSRTRTMLEGDTKITAGKDGIITIEFDHKDPQRAAEIANAYVEELLKLTQVLAVTEASQRRLFFERQFTQAKDNLAKAESAARQGLQQGGLVKVDDQGRAMIEVTARLRGQITVKEVQIGAMRAFATDQNPSLNLAQQELESLKRELAKIEGTGGARSATGAPSGQGMDNLRLLRDVKYYEVIFELLARQYELAKLDEARESSVIQVMDKAIAPDFKSKPTRWKIVTVAGMVALFVVILYVLIREALARGAGNPERVARVQALKRQLRPWGRRNA